mgnify:CR=1 FL=1
MFYFIHLQMDYTLQRPDCRVNDQSTILAAIQYSDSMVDDKNQRQLIIWSLWNQHRSPGLDEVDDSLIHIERCCKHWIWDQRRRMKECGGYLRNPWILTVKESIKYCVPLPEIPLKVL